MRMPYIDRGFRLKYDVCIDGPPNGIENICTQCLSNKTMFVHNVRFVHKRNVCTQCLHTMFVKQNNVCQTMFVLSIVLGRLNIERGGISPGFSPPLSIHINRPSNPRERSPIPLGDGKRNPIGPLGKAGPLGYSIHIQLGQDIER